MDTQPTANCCPKCHAPLPADAPQGLCPKCLLAAVATPTEASQPDGHRPKPPALVEIAAAFPQLEILEFIGQGGMGFVFKARQPKLDRLVALKILPQSLAADPTFAERFNREARLLARLNHPGIVTVHDFGVAVAAGILPAVEPGFQPGGKGVESTAGWGSSEAIASSDASPGGRMPPSTSGKMPDATSPVPRFYYLLMEFVDGVNLRQAMQAGRFTPDQALAIVPKICEALQFAHNEGILHRDIKPENILLDAKGRVKIADFGIAKLMDRGSATRSTTNTSIAADSAEDSVAGEAAAGHRPALHALTEAGKALGTPNYMAPEQLENAGEVDHRADIYSLGVVFYEMLTGELPLGRFAPPSQKSAADPRVDEVVLRALEKEKARRQTSAEEVRTQVETIVTGSSVCESAQTETAEGENQESGTDQSRLTSAATSESRFSRTAIVGACLIPLTSLIPVMVWWVRFPIKAEREKFGLLLAGVFLLIGVAAPMATTILGWLAVSQIRRSAGQIYGMWLAVFDGLLFPLFALVGLSTLITAKTSELLVEWLTSPVLGPVAYDSSPFVRRFISFLAYHPGVPLAVGACLGAVVGFFIIRRVWRAVNPGSSGRESAQTESLVNTEIQSRFASAATNQPSRFSRKAIAGACFALLLLLVVGALIVFNTQSPRFLDKAATVSSPTDTPGGQLTASGVTIGAMRVFGRDQYKYRFTVQDRTGKVLRLTELPIPFDNDKLRTDPSQVGGPLPDYYFGTHGRIEWELDGSAVVFSMRGVELTQLQVDRFSGPARPPAFGPVIERVVNDIGERQGSEALQLASGQLLSLPAPARELTARYTWMLANQADLLLDFTANHRLTLTAGIKLADFQAANWETATPVELAKALQTEATGLGHVVGSGEKEYRLTEKPVFPVTLAFQVAGGQRGLLQITGFNENPRGVKIRYKLVQNAMASGDPQATPASVSQMPTGTAGVPSGQAGHPLTLAKLNAASHDFKQSFAPLGEFQLLAPLLTRGMTKWEVQQLLGTNYGVEVTAAGIERWSYTLFWSRALGLDFRQGILVSGQDTGTALDLEDPIAALTERLSSSGGLWLNGRDPDLGLPGSASRDEVLKRVFERSIFDLGKVQDYRVLQTRTNWPINVGVKDTPGRFTAILVWTDQGRKIVLFQWNIVLGRVESGYWWSRVFDAPLPAQPAVKLDDNDVQWRWLASADDTNSLVDVFPDPTDLRGERQLRVLREVVLSSADVEMASVNSSGQTDQPQAETGEIVVLLNPQGEEKLAKAVAQNIGRHLVVVWWQRALNVMLVRSQPARLNIATDRLTNGERKFLLDLLNRHSSGSATRQGTDSTAPSPAASITTNGAVAVPHESTNSRPATTSADTNLPSRDYFLMNRQNVSYGPPTNGVSVSLRADKTIWSSDEPPMLRASLRNDGDMILETGRTDSHLQQVEVDGKWYRSRVTYYEGTGNNGQEVISRRGGRISQMHPGEQWDDVQISLRPGEWQRATTNDLALTTYPFRNLVTDATGIAPVLSLLPGKHTVRVAFVVATRAFYAFRVISNPVEIEIEGNSSTMVFSSADGKVVVKTPNGTLTADRIEFLGTNRLKAINQRMVVISNSPPLR